METRRLILPILVLASGTPALAAQPPPDSFIAAASCPTCQVGAISKVNLPYTGVEAYSMKLVNPQSNAIIPLTLMGMEPSQIRRSSSKRTIRLG